MKRVMMVLISCAVLLLAACSGKAVIKDAPAASETQAERVLPAANYIQPAEAFAGGSGTEDDPFQIETAQQLALLAKVTNRYYGLDSYEEEKLYRDGHYVLTADIALNDTSDFASWETRAPAYSWEPIGTKNEEDLPARFQGVFDGQGHTISGLYCSYPASDTNDEKAGGLFAKADGAQIRNVNITDSMLIVDSRREAGMLAADCHNSVIENCNVSARIIARGVRYGGGVIGSMTGDAGLLKGCSFSGKITAEDPGYLGGVCGSLSCLGEDLLNNASIEMENCRSSTGYGGIVGNVHNCILRSSRNCGNITVLGEAQNVGGICGQLDASFTYVRDENNEFTSVGAGAEIHDCTNSGDVTAKDGSATGGITGLVFNCFLSAEKITIQGCVNTGTVIGTEDVGGITGEISLSNNNYQLLDCVNTGSVEGDSNVGGIAGSANSCKGQSTMENCENQGNVTAQSSAGGILGWALIPNLAWEKEDSGALAITKCRNSGNVTIASNAAGGIVGTFMHPGYNIILELTKCENTGTIHSTDSGRLGGILGGSYAGYVIGSGNGAACYIRSCVNSGVLSYGDATVNAAGYDAAESGQNGRTLNPTEKTVMAIGGRTAGGIVGSTFCTVVESCLNQGHILLSEGMVPISDIEANVRVTEEDSVVFVGAICGQTLHSNKDGDTFEKEHYTDCAYTDGFAAAVYAPFLPTDSEIIAGNRRITEQEAKAMARELLK